MRFDVGFYLLFRYRSYRRAEVPPCPQMLPPIALPLSGETPLATAAMTAPLDTALPSPDLGLVDTTPRGEHVPC